MKRLLFIIAAVAVFSACSEDWLNVNPSTALTPETAFTNISDAQVALRGVYSNFFSSSGGATYYGADIMTYAGVKADDERCWQPGKRTQSQYNYLEVPESSTSGFWTVPFRGLMNVNAIISKIDGLEPETPQEEEIKESIKGQSLAIRALLHFDLVRIYGRMPQGLGSNPSTDLGVPVVTRVVAPDEKLSRNTVSEVYQQVITDLTDAIPLLPDAINTQGQINSWAAKSLLARVYLYNGQNDLALSTAQDVINNSPYSLIPKDNFVAYWATGGGSESIFEIVMTSTENSDREGIGYLWDPTGYGAITLADSFVDLLAEDEDDVRNDLITEDNRDGRMAYLLKFPGKDDASTRVNNVRVIRLAEVYLIAAEAAVKIENNSTTAQGYLEELIGTRIGDDSFTIPANEVTLERVLLERRKELVGEGHRFFDLMRNGIAVERVGDDHWTNDMTLAPDDYRVIQPIPKFETDANPNMVQNPNYN